MFLLSGPCSPTHLHLKIHMVQLMGGGYLQCGIVSHTCHKSQHWWAMMNFEKSPIQWQKMWEQPGGRGQRQWHFIYTVPTNGATTDGTTRSLLCLWLVETENKGEFGSNRSTMEQKLKRHDRRLLPLTLRSQLPRRKRLEGEHNDAENGETHRVRGLAARLPGGSLTRSSEWFGERHTWRPEPLTPPAAFRAAGGGGSVAAGGGREEGGT